MRSSKTMMKSVIAVVAMYTLGHAAQATILSTSFVDGRYTGAESQTLTGYLPSVADAPNLTQDFSTGTTLDWHSWGAGNGPDTSACCPTTWMVGGAGIGEQSTAFGDINLVFYSTPYTTGNWDWSDGTPTASGDHNNADLDADAGARWLIHPTTQNPGTADFIQFSFDGAPAGTVRAATMQLRRDYELPVKAIQGGQEVVIDSTGGDGLFTVEYNGPDTVYFVIDGSTAPVGQVFVRGFAATLSEVVPEPGTLGLLALGGGLIALIRRRV